MGRKLKKLKKIVLNEEQLSCLIPSKIVELERIRKKQKGRIAFGELTVKLAGDGTRFKVTGPDKELRRCLTILFVIQRDADRAAQKTI